MGKWSLPRGAEKHDRIKLIRKEGDMSHAIYFYLFVYGKEKLPS